MAETAKGHKLVRVPGYVREDGTKVRPLERSTPKTAQGKEKGQR